MPKSSVDEGDTLKLLCEAKVVIKLKMTASKIGSRNNSWTACDGAAIRTAHIFGHARFQNVTANIARLPKFKMATTKPELEIA